MTVIASCGGEGKQGRPGSAADARCGQNLCSGRSSAEMPFDSKASMSTLFAICIVVLLKGVVCQMLPSSFRAMEADLKLQPDSLGMLALAQGVAWAVFGPIWGNLVDSGLPRIQLLMVSMAIAGVSTLTLAFFENFAVMIALRVGCGVGTAAVTPIVACFVAEMTTTATRGRTFGWVYVFSCLGEVFTCLFVTPTSTAVYFDVPGWRLALLIVGTTHLLVVPCLPKVMWEPRSTWNPKRCGIIEELKKLWKFTRIRTFVVILLQGFFGTIPGAALSFMTMYLQYAGMSDTIVALILALHVLGCAIGGFLGGAIGDALHAKSPKYGRVLTAQMSILLCIPCVVIMFFVIPATQDSTGIVAVIFVILGTVSSWVSPGCIHPVLCDVIARRDLASAFAWELALVFACGNAIGPVTVGYFAQYYGYHKNSEQVSDTPPLLRSQNAEALSSSMLVACVVPWTLCALFFTLMYFTYNDDIRQPIHDDSDEESDVAETPNESTRLFRPKGTRC